MESKLCRSCQVSKTVDMFQKDVHNADQLKRACRECTSSYMRKYREKRGADYAEKERQQAREYHWKKTDTEESLAKQLDILMGRFRLVGVEPPVVPVVPVIQRDTLENMQKNRPVPIDFIWN